MPAPHANSPTRPAADAARRREWLFIVGFLALFAGLFVATLSHYGPTWDIWELYFGDKTLRFYMTLDTRHLDFSQPDLEVYRRPDHPAFESTAQAAYMAPMFWPVGFVSAAITKHLFFTRFHLLDAIDAHHLVLILWVGGLYYALYRFVLREYGSLAAIIATLALATHPQMVAHSHFNLKDVPLTTMFALVMFALHRATQRQRTAGVILAAALWGVALATKANAIFIPVIVALYLTSDMLLRWRRRQSLPGRRWWIALAVAPLVALLVMLALWPYLWTNFPDNLGAHLDFIRSRGLEGHPGWNLTPLKLALTTTPLPALILFAVGVVHLVISAWRQGLQSRDILLAIWIAVPIFRVSMPHAKDFDGIRHWMEFLPAAAIIAGAGGAWMLRALLRRVVSPAPDAPFVPPSSPATGQVETDPAHIRFERHLPNPAFAGAVVVALLWFAPTIAWNIRAHPYQIVFFNRLIGGPAGAQRGNWTDATDYWGSSYREGLRLLNAHAEPGAVVVPGVAQHIVVLTAKNWLRPDLTLVHNTRTPMLMGYNRVPVYFMTITRPHFYPPYWPQLEREHGVWRQIEVDGVPILKIIRMPPAPPPQARPATRGAGAARPPHQPAGPIDTDTPVAAIHREGNT